LTYSADLNEKPVNNAPFYQGGFMKGSTSINLGTDIIAGGVRLDADTAKIFYMGVPSVGWVRTLSTGKIKYQLFGQELGIYQTSISSDGKYLATRGDGSEYATCSATVDGYTSKDPLGDSTLALRSALNGKIIAKYKNACYGPVFTNDSKKLIYSDYKYNLHIVNLP
jgi:hypothetical protein